MRSETSILKMFFVRQLSSITHLVTSQNCCNGFLVGCTEGPKVSLWKLQLHLEIGKTKEEEEE